MNKHAVQRGQYYASGAGDSRNFWESQTATWLAVRPGEGILKADSETTTPLRVFTAQLVVEALWRQCQSVMYFMSVSVQPAGFYYTNRLRF